jgi:precorrin-6x reductase
LNNCTKGGKYALHGAVQNALAKALNGDNIKAVIVEAHPYATESSRTDISISTAGDPGEILYYVDTTVTNTQQKQTPKLKTYC